MNEPHHEVNNINRLQVGTLLCNQGVTGSNPVTGTIFFNRLRKPSPSPPLSIVHSWCNHH